MASDVVGLSAPDPNNAENTSTESITEDETSGGSTMSRDMALPSSSCGYMGQIPDMDSGFDELGSSSKKFRRVKEEKICRVCGDKALGYNFNAVTCESCKAFFRRNALKQDQPPCLFQNNCTIDVRTRRFCPHCRLERCFGIGMKKEMILDETERKARMQKVVMNRKRKMTKPCPMDLPVMVKEEPKEEPETPMPDTQSTISESLQAFDDDDVPRLQFGDSSKDSSIPRFQSDQLPTDHRCFRVLSEEENSVIDVLTTTYSETLGGFSCDPKINHPDQYSSINDLVNNSEIAVRRLIKFVKKVADFRILSQENQVASLKSCVLNALLLRSVNFYDVEKDAWKTPTGSIPTSVLKQATGYNSLHDAHTSYCASLKRLTRDDGRIMALLQTIVLFNPDGQNIEDRQFISNIQDKYIQLLRHYLENSVSYKHAPVYFALLLQKVAELKGLGEDHAKILLQVNASQIEPLMLEVLNLH